MSKDQLLKKYPDHKEAVEYFVQRAPNGNLKFVEWEMKVLTARQAMKEEIADVVDLFNKFNQKLEKKDIYQYQPQELAALREKLFAIREEQQGRRQERQKKVDKLYYSAPDDIACGHKVVYDSETLRCLQITNKAAATHYGMETEWCIRLKDQSYWEDYDKNNVVFFFLFNKQLDKSSSYYKVAFSYMRNIDNSIMEVDTWDTKDNKFDSRELAGKYSDAMLNKKYPDKRSRDPYANNGEVSKINEEQYKQYMQELPKIYSSMLNIAKAYPKSLLARIESNELSVDEVVKVYEKEKSPDVARYLQKWLIKNVKDDKHAPLIHDIAVTTRDPRLIHDLTRSQSPIVLDGLVDNIIIRNDMDANDYLESVSHNTALSQSSIEKIFKWYRNGKATGQLIGVVEGDDLMEGRLLSLPNCPPNELLEHSKHKSAHIREQVAKNRNTPTKAIDFLINQTHTSAGNGYYFALSNPNASEQVLKDAFDQDQVDGLAILQNPNATPDLLRHIFNYFKRSISQGKYKWNSSARAILDEQPNYYKAFFKNKNTPPDILEYLYDQIKDFRAMGQFSSKDIRVLALLFNNPNTSSELKQRIIKDHPFDGIVNKEPITGLYE